MEPIKLKDKDYNFIRNKAELMFKDKNYKLYIKESQNFLSYCYSKAFMEYCQGEGWEIKDGQIFKQSK